MAAWCAFSLLATAAIPLKNADGRCAVVDPVAPSRLVGGARGVADGGVVRARLEGGHASDMFCMKLYLNLVSGLGCTRV